MGYKLLGYVVWHGARFFVRRRYGHLVPPRGALIAGATGLAVIALAVGAKRASS